MQVGLRYQWHAVYQVGWAPKSNPIGQQGCGAAFGRWQPPMCLCKQHIVHACDPASSQRRAPCTAAGHKKMMTEAEEGLRWSHEALSFKRQLGSANEALNKARTEVGVSLCGGRSCHVCTTAMAHPLRELPRFLHTHRGLLLKRHIRAICWQQALADAFFHNPSLSP